jgi:predicted nucleotidyltransferase
MKDKIISELEKIEALENIKILYACESGSRAWGFPSKDSDYDVRFIYIHPLEWYLSIDDKRDVIERPINGLLDISGWDLPKALKLLRKSNPPLLEWLQSPLVYWEKSAVAGQMRRLSPLTFSPQSCMYHYLNMAKRNFREYLQSDQVKVKKYFYVLRPVFACLWIKRYNTMPPLLFEGLVAELLPDGPLKQVIGELLNRKKAGEELDTEPQISVINQFLEAEINNIENYLQTITKPQIEDIQVFDRIFQDALKAVWGQNRTKQS